jgi:hypothetical protein
MLALDALMLTYVLETLAMPGHVNVVYKYGKFN